MRRFELEEGSSSKFWQVSVDGTQLRVSFGRIGSQGQIKLKAFDSREGAEAEAEKLIKEKVKKGYSEVEVALGAAVVSTESASTTSTSTATTSKEKPTSTSPSRETTTSISDEKPTSISGEKPTSKGKPTSTSTAKERADVLLDGVAWTEGNKRGLTARFGSDLVVPKPLDGKASYAKLAAAMKAVQPAIQRGLKSPNAEVLRMQAVIGAFSTPAAKTPLDETLQADAFALFGANVAYDDKPRHAELLRFWAATAGAAFALRAYVRGMSTPTHFVDAGSYSLMGGSGAVVLLSSPVHAEPPWWRARPVKEHWRALREVVLLAGESARGELTTLAGELRESAPLHVQVTLALAFESTDWARTALGAELDKHNIERCDMFALALLMPTVDEAFETMSRVASSPWSLIDSLKEHAADLIWRFGPAAANRIVPLLRAANESYADALRIIAESVALVPSDEIGAFFVDALAQKTLRAIASDYIKRFPAVCLAPLLERAMAKGAAAESAKTALKSVVASQDPSIEAMLPSLSGSARALVDAIKANAAPDEEASEGELPRVLRERPWTKKRSAPERVVLERVAPLPFEESMAWRAGEREQRDRGRRYIEDDPEKVASTLKRIEEAQREADQRLHGDIFSTLPDDLAIAALDAANLKAFSWQWRAAEQVFVARYELAIVPTMLRFAEEIDVAAAASALDRMCSPRVAPVFARAFGASKKARAIATEWLLRFPEAATVGLVPTAVGPASARRNEADAVLRWLASRGHGDVVRDVAKRHGAEVAAAIGAVLDFDPLLVLPKKVPSLPGFFSPGAFSRPLLRGRTKALPLESVEAIGTMLAFSPPDDPYAGLLEVKAACDPRSLAEFSWDLFQAWLMAGAPAKEQWAFAAVGLFGDDECARRLTPLVRAWPGEAAHARAVMGLEVLARIGTDVALMFLHGIAQKLKFKGLQEKAREKIDAIAEARGLSADELADRLVPDLGLDEGGSLTLDFGPRTFKVVFDESLKPLLIEGDGTKRLPDLPKPNKADDAEKAKEATERWRTLKKDAKTIAQSQLLRLELAMCTQRRWPQDVFRTFMVEHPLVVHLVRRVVWGAFGAESDALLTTFRVVEDSTYADDNDDAVTLPEGARVGLVHRLEMPDEAAAAWGQRFADYEMLAPFHQLGRSVAVPTASEKTSKVLERVKGIKVPTGKVLGLDVRGWRRGPAQDAGVVCWYEKPLQGGLVAFLDLEPGIYTGMISESPEQTLGDVGFAREGYWSKETGVPVSELSPIVFSELARDLDTLKP